MSPFRPARRAGAAALVAAALMFPSCASPGTADPVPGPVPLRTFAVTEVDADVVVEYDGGEVVTPCFVYRAPDASWTLVPGSVGCSTGVAFGSDMLSMVQVRAVTARGSIEELAAQTLADDPDGEVTRLELAGHDVARAVTSGEPAIASYVLAYPDSGLTGGGDPVRAIVLTTMSSAEYEGLVEQIVDTLTRPDGSPL